MRVCVVAYTFYEYDSRVRRYADSLSNLGHQVDVIALRYRDRASVKSLNKVRVSTIQSRDINERRSITYLFRVALFFLKAMCLLTWRHFRKPYAVFHIHSVPDFLVFTALIPKLMGAKIVLDIHDLLPEFYASKFGPSHSSLIRKLLVAVERASAAFADHVIVANHLWRDRLLARCIRDPKKCAAILNYPDLTIFDRRPSSKPDRFIFIYPGTLSYHQGIDIAIRAFALIKEDLPQAEFHIYGNGDQKLYLMQLIDELRLQERVLLKDIVPLSQIAEVMAQADVGLVPKRAEGFGNEAFSTKILEFMAVGIPVIVSDTQVDKYYFDESMVKFFRSSDIKDLADAMLQLMKSSELRVSLARNATDYIKRNNWAVKQTEYIALVERLVGRT